MFTYVKKCLLKKMSKNVYLCQKAVITMKNQVRPVCSPVYSIDFAVKLITISFRNNLNPGAGDQFYPYGEFSQYPQHPPGWNLKLNDLK